MNADEFDITFPSIGPDTIVYQAGGRLYLLDLQSEKSREVPVKVVTDEMTLRPRTAKAEALIEYAAVSPAGKRAVFQARGEIFTVPAENGAVVNATRSSGVAERYPRWSPDGKTLAYWSDRSGEYELTISPAETAGSETRLTSLGAGFRYAPFWSPDSGKLAFIDQAIVICIHDIKANRTTEVDRSPEWIAEGHGVEPDIRVDEDPAQLAKGIDPQLERAIKEVTDRAAKHPRPPTRPGYETRIPQAGP